MIRKYLYPEQVGADVQWHDGIYRLIREAARKYAKRRGWRFELDHDHGFTSIRRVA